MQNESNNNIITPESGLAYFNALWDKYLDQYEEDRPEMASPFFAENNKIYCKAPTKDVEICDIEETNISGEVSGFGLSIRVKGCSIEISYEWEFGAATPELQYIMYIKPVVLYQKQNDK